MLRDIMIEYAKLKRTLAVTLCLVAPSLASALLMLICLKSPGTPWTGVIMNVTAIWAFFVLPMTLAALSALLGQIEHGPRMWDHILSLPLPRWRLFTAKGVVIISLIVLMSVLLLTEVAMSGIMLRVTAPEHAPTGVFPAQVFITVLAEIAAAGLFMAMIQLWVALATRSFVAPLTVGIAGAFFAIGAMSAKEAIFIPWVMPIKVLLDHGAHAMLAVQLGLWGGLVTWLLMILHLSHKEA
jgi:ABC-2 type transport system permease protein